MADEPQSRILLPLRTSVDLFSDPTQPSALTRAKQAAALHDHVIVEVGHYNVSLTDHGGSQIWIPPEMMTPEHVAQARKPPEEGAPMTLAFGAQEGKGVPARNMVTAVSGPISMAYGAEWHSEVLDPLATIGVDFIEPIATGGDNPFDSQSDIGKTVARQDRIDWLDDTLMPGVNTFRRDFIRKSFTRDAAIAQDFDAVLQVSTLFQPMLERHGWKATGMTAIEIAAPNLGELEWEQVLEFREHPGAQEARQRLREWERVAAEQEPRDAREFLLSVSQQATKDMLAAWEDKRRSLGEAVIEESAKTLVGFFPFVGPFIGGVVSVGEAAAESRVESRSGIAALMKLRPE
jgi:hypothetical protein